MARKTKRQRSRSAKTSSPSRAIWKGSIDFGLVSIPIRLYSAEAPGTIDLDLLDKRDFAKVRYRRVNEETGKEVPWTEIVKGYRYDDNQYVALSDEDFAQANVEATQTIAISDFVDAKDVSPLYYDKPYYLEPLKNGRRAYALLREVLAETGKVGIASVVIRTRQHLAMLLADGTRLVLNLLRYSHELRDASGLDLPGTGKGAGVSAREVDMAKQLVKAMHNKWDPEKYRDDYRDDLMKVIAQKIKAGKTKAVETGRPAPRRRRGKVIDIMHLLQRSVKEAGDRKEQAGRRRRAS